MKKRSLLASLRSTFNGRVVFRLALATLVVSGVQLSFLSVELAAQPAKSMADVLKSIPKYKSAQEMENALKRFNGNVAAAKEQGRLMSAADLALYELYFDSSTDKNGIRLLGYYQTRSGFHAAAYYTPGVHSAEANAIHLILLKNGKRTKRKDGMDEMGMGQTTIVVIDGNGTQLKTIKDAKHLEVEFGTDDNTAHYKEEKDYFHPM